MKKIQIRSFSHSLSSFYNIFRKWTSINNLFNFQPHSLGNVNLVYIVFYSTHISVQLFTRLSHPSITPFITFIHLTLSRWLYFERLLLTLASAIRFRTILIPPFILYFIASAFLFSRPRPFPSSFLQCCSFPPFHHALLPSIVQNFFHV